MSNRALRTRSLAIRCTAVLALAGMLYAAARTDPNVLCLLPALAMALMLVGRRYPGERLLLALRGVRPNRWPRPRPCVPSRRHMVLLAVRGGQLIGCSLASRPPPAPSPAS